MCCCTIRTYAAYELHMCWQHQLCPCVAPSGKPSFVCAVPRHAFSAMLLHCCAMLLSAITASKQLQACCSAGQAVATVPSHALTVLVIVLAVLVIVLAVLVIVLACSATVSECVNTTASQETALKAFPASSCCTVAVLCHHHARTLTVLVVILAVLVIVLAVLVIVLLQRHQQREETTTLSDPQVCQQTVFGRADY